MYTLYNKSGAPVTGEAIEVENLPDWHWVECLSDVEAAAQQVNVAELREEVAPFVRQRRSLEVWSQDFFLQLIDRIEAVQ